MRVVLWTVVSIVLAFASAAYVLVFPPQGYAAAAITWLALVAAFIVLAVQVPAFVSAAEHGSRPSWREAGRVLVDQAPIELAVASMLAAAVLLTGINVAGGATLIWLLAFGLAVLAAAGAAAVEEAWGHRSFMARAGPRRARR